MLNRRISRKTYAIYLGFIFISCLIFEFFMAWFIGNSMWLIDSFFIGFVFNAIKFIWYGACIVLTVQRLHDCDFSGWWSVISIVPFIDFLMIIFLLCRAGDAEENRFGSVPEES